MNGFVPKCFVLDELHSRYKIVPHEWLRAQLLRPGRVPSALGVRLE